MISTKPLSSLRISEDAMRVLRFYSESLTVGKSIDYRTPMFSVPSGGPYPYDKGARISGVDGLVPLSREYITSIFVPRIYELIKNYPVIHKFESEFVKYTLSSRSQELPGAKKKEKLIQSFQNQDRTIGLMSKPDAEGILQRAAIRLAKFIRKYIPIKSLRPANIPNIVQRMTKSSNGGFPYLKRGHVVEHGKVVVDNVPLYVDIARKIEACLVSGRPIPVEYRAFGALSRLQEGKRDENGPQTKNRIVWGDAHGATIIAGYAYPYLDASKRLPTRKILINLDEVNKQLAALVRQDNNIISADQSAFDNHIRGDIFVKYIAPIILDSFNGENKDTEKIALQGYLTEHMGNDPIVCPDGVGYGRHGMPSGVLFVNEVDSMYLQFVTFVYNELHGTERYTTVAVQGDDQVMTTSLSLAEAANGFEKDSELMNLEANADKQGIANDSCTFVKRLGTRECPDGYRSKIGTLVSEMNMERAKDWKRAMYEARGGSILCNHYLTEPGIDTFFSQICMGYTEYQLGYKLVDGYVGVLRRAGGVADVSRRLDLSSYANHLGTKPKSDAWELDVNNLTLQTGMNESKAKGGKELHGSWIGDSLRSRH